MYPQLAIGTSEAPQRTEVHIYIYIYTYSYLCIIIVYIYTHIYSISTDISLYPLCGPPAQVARAGGLLAVLLWIIHILIMDMQIQLK